MLRSLCAVKNLLISPSKMSLSISESALYQKVLQEVAPLSLNLMAVKITERPEDFNGWCLALLDVCNTGINRDLMDEAQFKPLKKMTQLLAHGVSISQFKMASISPWALYCEFLQSQATLHALDERLRLLSYVESLNLAELGDFISEDRLAVLGKHHASHDPKVYNFDVGWFGNTKAAKAFHELISVNPHALDNVMSVIPATGEVSQTDYAAFITAFIDVMISAGDKPSLAVATRLLSMKRPDQFVVVNSSKIDELCQGLNIAKFKLHDFESYWTDVIGTIRKMHWYNSEAPTQTFEKSLWDNRVILMDLLFWCDEEHAEKSNYLRMLHKPTKARSASKSTRRSKESATELVDRVLALEETPEFLKAQRNSIISQVEAGKKIDDVINLLNKIFSD